MAHSHLGLCRIDDSLGYTGFFAVLSEGTVRWRTPWVPSRLGGPRLLTIRIASVPEGEHRHPLQEGRSLLSDLSHARTVPWTFHVRTQAHPCRERNGAFGDTLLG